MNSYQARARYPTGIASVGHQSDGRSVGLANCAARPYGFRFVFQRLAGISVLATIHTLAQEQKMSGIRKVVVFLFDLDRTLVSTIA